MAQYRYQGNILVKKTDREDYRFAVICNCNDGKVSKVFISTTKDKVQAMFNTELNAYYRNIENCTTAIQAIKEGRDSYVAKEGRGPRRISLKNKTIEYYEDWMEENKKRLDYIVTHWQVVEVEKA